MSTTARIKDKLKRQSTWSGIGLVALALTPVFPAYAAYLSALAGVSAGLKLILSEDSTKEPGNAGQG
jgi:hypothetical protein